MTTLLDRKIKHLQSLKRSASELSRRIQALEKEVSREMVSAYREVSLNN